MSIDEGSDTDRARQYGVRASATADLDDFSAISAAVPPVTQPPQLKPIIARAIAPTPAPQSAGSVHFGSSKVYPIYIDTNTQDHVP